MKQKNIPGRQSFHYKSTLIFCLTSIVPLVLLLTLLDRFELLPNTEVATLMVICLLIALLGFFFFPSFAKSSSRSACRSATSTN